MCVSSAYRDNDDDDDDEKDEEDVNNGCSYIVIHEV